MDQEIANDISVLWASPQIRSIWQVSPLCSAVASHLSVQSSVATNSGILKPLTGTLTTCYDSLKRITCQMRRSCISDPPISHHFLSLSLSLSRTWSWLESARPALCYQTLNTRASNFPWLMSVVNAQSEENGSIALIMVSSSPLCALSTDFVAQ